MIEILQNVNCIRESGSELWVIIIVNRAFSTYRNSHEYRTIGDHEQIQVSI